MYFPRAPRVPSFASGRPNSTGTDRTVLGVGSRVLVTCPKGESRAVTLTDDAGTSPVAELAGGVEVEIVAWRPRRGGETRYRVVSTKGRVEGWLGAGSLTPRPTPPAAKRIETAETVQRAAPTRAKAPTSRSARAVVSDSAKAIAKSTGRGAAVGGRRMAKEIR